MPPVLFDTLYLAVGAGMLYLGAEWLVKGAAGIALALRIAPAVVGATVVAYATSAPELAVSLAAALGGKSAITLGNVIGSNVANIGLILGLTALIAAPRVEAGLIKRELPVLVASAVLPVFLLHDGLISRVEGLLLLLGSVSFTLLMLRAHAAESAAPVADEPKARRKLAHVALLVVGLAVLVGGSKVLVDGAVGVAHAFGMSERVVGLTIVAVGTSLPELAASIVAVARGHADIAIGNVVGSNIFNMLLILGATTLVRPVEGSLAILGPDLAVLVATTLACALVLRTGRVVRRWEGVLLLGGYLASLGRLAAE